MNETTTIQQGHDLSILQAKLIVLGDPITGKSHFIRNLKRDTYDKYPTPSTSGSEVFFHLVEFPMAELRNSASNILLKVWEHSPNTNLQEELLAYRGVLFCVITFNLCHAETATSVFQRWLEIKDKYMSEAFLFVIGTHVDLSLSRQVDTAEICKSCAQINGVYLEVSNTKGYNLKLFRKLLGLRINRMIELRDQISKQPFIIQSLYPPSVRSIDDSDSNKPYSEEMKSSPPNLTGSPTAKHVDQVMEGDLMPPFYSDPLMVDSIGSLYASSIGLESWPGFEIEQKRIEEVGIQLHNMMDELSNQSNLPNDDNYHGMDALPKMPTSTSLTLELEEIFAKINEDEKNFVFNNSKEDKSPSSNDAVHTPSRPMTDELFELKNAFDIMGITFPKSLEDTLKTQENKENKEKPRHKISNTRNSLILNHDKMTSHQTAHEKNASENVETTPKSSGSGNSSSHPTSPISSPIKDTGVPSSYLRKIVVKLPNVQSSDMIIDLYGDIEMQVHLFFISHHVSDGNHDQKAEKKLIDFIYHMKELYQMEKGSGTPTINEKSVSGGPGAVDHVEEYRAKKKYKIRLSLPMTTPSSSNSGSSVLTTPNAASHVTSIEVIVNKDDDFRKISGDIRNQYQLSDEQHQIILKQLMKIQQ